MNTVRPDGGETWPERLLRWRGERAIARLRAHQHGLRALRRSSQAPRLVSQCKAPHGPSFDATRGYGFIDADRFNSLLTP